MNDDYNDPIGIESDLWSGIKEMHSYLALLHKRLYSSSPSASSIPLKMPFPMDRRLMGVSNSTHSPESITKTRSQSIIVCKRCAIVTTVQSANVSRIVC